MAVITTIRAVITVISAKPLPCGILKSLWSQMGALPRLAADRRGHSCLPGTQPAAWGSFHFLFESFLSVWELLSQQRTRLPVLEAPPQPLQIFHVSLSSPGCGGCPFWDTTLRRSTGDAQVPSWPSKEGAGRAVSAQQPCSCVCTGCVVILWRLSASQRSLPKGTVRRAEHHPGLQSGLKLPWALQSTLH